MTICRRCHKKEKKKAEKEKNLAEMEEKKAETEKQKALKDQAKAVKDKEKAEISKGKPRKQRRSRAPGPGSTIRNPLGKTVLELARLCSITSTPRRLTYRRTAV